PPPDNTRILVMDNGDGTATVKGEAGAVLPSSRVNLTNARTGAVVSLTANPDGSFQALVDAVAGDVIIIDNDGPARIALPVS
ncbi:MAG: hypothetical protein D6736_10570, partial [Nitrospinota bacterium]